MATFVLVPGAWLGGWAWRDVADRLRALGHRVYPVTLTGLGERVHLATPAVDLDTHVADVVNLMAFEDLSDVVLVGHSYAGEVVESAADRAPERIAQVVYVDSGPLGDGVALLDTYSPQGQQAVRREVATAGDGWRLPMPSWEDLSAQASLTGLGPAERALIERHAVPHPFATYTQPVRLTNPAAGAAMPKTAILCSFSEADVRAALAAGVPMMRGLAGPNWRFVELPTGHWPMFSEPARLAETLERVGR
ncbi:MAG TPA: alpha/beta hydrolase [Thermomicrobiales bacterium]|nr:alpha/beta hydrolase [Thermomicrobiales bacterium]